MELNIQFVLKDGFTIIAATFEISNSDLWENPLQWPF